MSNLEEKIATFLKGIRNIYHSTPLDSVIWHKGINDRLYCVCKSCDNCNSNVSEICHKETCEHYRIFPTFRFYSDLRDFYPSNAKWDKPNAVIGYYDLKKIDDGVIYSEEGGKAVIFAARNKDTNEVWMTSEHPSIQPYPELHKSYDSLKKGNWSVYLCGGNNETLSVWHQERQLEYLQKINPNLSYELIHLNDANQNNLAIDAKTGKYIVNRRKDENRNLASLGLKWDWKNNWNANWKFIRGYWENSFTRRCGFRHTFPLRHRSYHASYYGMKRF